QAKLVAKGGNGLVQGAQVERNGHVDLFVGNVVATTHQVFTQRARCCGQQDIVDRGAHGAPQVLDVLQVQGFGPGYAFSPTQPALEAGGRVGRHYADAGQFGADGEALFGQLQKILGVTNELPALRQKFLAELKAVLQDAAGRMQAVMAVGLGRQCDGFYRLANRCHGGGVGNGEQHPYQGQAVSNAVVDPGNQRGAAVVVLHQVYLPQGAGIAEGRAVKVGGQLLEFEYATIAGQCHPMDMMIQIEGGGIFAVVAAILADNALAEALEGQKAFFDHGFEIANVDRVVQNQHHANHHQIGGRFHSQPCGIHR